MHSANCIEHYAQRNTCPSENFRYFPAVISCSNPLTARFSIVQYAHSIVCDVDHTESSNWIRLLSCFATLGGQANWRAAPLCTTALPKALILTGSVGRYDRRLVGKDFAASFTRGLEMTHKKVSLPATKAYAAFLFTDPRGFTAFPQTYGDKAIFCVVQRFYKLVENQNLYHARGEWQAAGYQILLAFSNAHQAVSTAVKVMEDIEAHNRSNPEYPIRVGIGLDAIEPVASEGDFTDTAVNRAARMTASAEVGQILVTETIRHLAGNLPNIVYLDRGRHTFHGFGKAQQVYELVWSGTQENRLVRTLLGSQAPLKEKLHLTAHIGLGMALTAAFLVAALYSGTSSVGFSTPWRAAGVAPMSDVGTGAKSTSQLVADSRRFTVFIASNNSEGVQLGSGVVYDSTGLVVTAAHVVQDVDNVDIRLWNGSVVSAEVLGKSKEYDLALLRMPKARYPAATLGDSSKVQGGDEIMVLGYPAIFRFRASATATRGMISQTIAGPQSQYLQIDADLNPGDSGGPLLNSAGQVIGINVGRLERLRGRAIQGIGIAIPSRTVQETIAKLTRGD